jgi:hypothetical protein
MSTIYRTVSGHCRRGLHEMTPENTYLHTKGWKLCRACRRGAQGRSQEKRRETQKVYLREWRQENQVALTEMRRRHRQKIKAAIDERKTGKPCMDCGGMFPPVAMDFDHVRGKKLFNVGMAKSLEALDSEIEKCDLVCANCHRVRTATRIRSGLQPDMRMDL